MNEIPQRVSESVRRRNPHLYGGAAIKGVVEELAADERRLRQRAGAKMNKTEEAFLSNLKATDPAADVHAQAVTLVLANGVRYTPDFFCFDWAGAVTAWEVKGPRAWDDAIVKLKVAARIWPQVRFVLVWRDGPGWREQAVLA